MAADLAGTFAAIQPLFARHAGKGVVLHDEPGRYYLGTHEVRPNDGYRTWLGGVEIKKSYVSAHLIPVYTYPELLDGGDPALIKRMQGKSCFNFKNADPELLAELEALIETAVARFEQDGKLTA
jgi:hypothetical protein